jgi:hypothetical protein
MIWDGPEGMHTYSLWIFSPDNFSIVAKTCSAKAVSITKNRLVQSSIIGNNFSNIPTDVSQIGERSLHVRVPEDFHTGNL